MGSRKDRSVFRPRTDITEEIEPTASRYARLGGYNSCRKTEFLAGVIEYCGGKITFLSLNSWKLEGFWKNPSIFQLLRERNVIFTLCRPLPGASITQTNYNCSNELMTRYEPTVILTLFSDHSPVCATFLLKTLQGNIPSKFSPCRIVFTNLRAEGLKSVDPNKELEPYIVFSSPAADGSRATPAMKVGALGSGSKNNPNGLTLSNHLGYFLIHCQVRFSFVSVVLSCVER